MKREVNTLFLAPPHLPFITTDIQQICEQLEIIDVYQTKFAETLAHAQDLLDEATYDLVICHSKLTFSIWSLKDFCMTDTKFVIAGTIEDIIIKELHLKGFEGSLDIQTPYFKLEFHESTRPSVYASPSILNLLNVFAFARLLTDYESTFGLDMSIYYALSFRIFKRLPVDKSKSTLLLEKPIEVTPRQLLSHQAGLRPSNTHDEASTLVLSTLLHQLSLDKSYYHCQLTYQVLALIIDIYTENYQHYLQSSIIANMGMQDTLLQKTSPHDVMPFKSFLSHPIAYEKLILVDEIDSMLAKDYLEKIMIFAEKVEGFIESMDEWLAKYQNATDSFMQHQYKTMLEEEIDLFQQKSAEELLLLRELDAFIAFYEEERDGKKEGTKSYQEQVFLIAYFQSLKNYLLAEESILFFKQKIYPSAYLGLNLFTNLVDLSKLQDCLLSEEHENTRFLLNLELNAAGKKDSDYLFKPCGYHKDKNYSIEHISQQAGNQSGFTLFPNMNCRVTYLSNQLEPQRETIQTLIAHLFFAEQHHIYYLDERMPSPKLSFIPKSIIDSFDENDTIANIGL